MTCKVCGNEEGNIPYTAREMMYGTREAFPYFQCKSCACLQILEFPENMRPHYPRRYYSLEIYDGRKFKGLAGQFRKLQYRASVFPSGVLAALLNGVLGKREYWIFEGLGVAQKSRILDVGCGNGRSFLYPLAEIGFVGLMGCDPFLEQDIHYANGLRIRKGSVHEMSGTWDVITYHHSFEHVADPQAQLNRVAELLAPGGLCIIRIPTVSSWAWEHYRTNWAQLDAPRHFFLHSRESMERMAAQAGMELYGVVYDSNHFQFSGSEKLVNDVPLSAPCTPGLVNAVKRKIKKMGYARRARQLNRSGRGDQAAFFFRRPTAINPGAGPCRN
ncbi:MAG: hypothetical protein AMJ67_17025 [Betaproteobacteria bacterium SG8_41]|nr:MAG: hypothetical protein AMJ67_17025 [Betaproteobacteria bacterium SG8_41]